MSVPRIYTRVAAVMIFMETCIVVVKNSVWSLKHILNSALHPHNYGGESTAECECANTVPITFPRMLITAIR